jgi:class 3 adenylate cyclase/CHASE2 domain-containing sensor protein
MNPEDARPAQSFWRGRAFAQSTSIVVISVLATFLAILAVNHFMVLTNADNFIQDWEISVGAPQIPVDPDIVVVAVREDTLEQFQYRSPIDRAFLAGLLTKLAAAKPKAIGIDYLFDRPTESTKDAQLKSAIATLGVPLAVAYTEDPQIVSTDQLAYIRDFVPLQRRAMVNLATDQYGTARFVFPGAKDAQGHYIPGFDRALAADAGVKTPAIPLRIVWTKPVSDENLSLLDKIGGAIKGRSEDTSSFLELHAQVASLFPPQTFANKVVLIGSDVSLDDRHRTPFAAISDQGNMAGIVVHAYGISSLLHNKHSPYASWQLNFIVALALAFMGSGLGALNFYLWGRVTALAVLVIGFWVAGGAYYFLGNAMIDLVAPSLAMIASFSGMDSLAGREARRQRQFIEGAFSRYVSPKVVEALIADPTRMALQGERREMTFLFTDVADFTTMSERIDSKALQPLLNAYFEGVTSIILRYEGMVDKFIGDAVFAIFNAPVDLVSHQEKAVRCGLEIDAFCENFRKEQYAKGGEFGLTRIGIHTGSAVIGNFGSSFRFTYTAQGDAVNTAARLEGMNKYFGTHLCASGATRSACSNILFRQMGSVILKGKTQAIEVWEPLMEGALTADQLARYQIAYNLLNQNAEEALAQFEALSRERPEDPCIRFYLARLRDGVAGSNIKMTDK